MEENKGDFAIEEKMAVSCSIDIDLDKSKTVDIEDFKKHLPEPEFTRTIGLTNHRKNAIFKELRMKLRCMVAENSSGLEQKSQLHHQVLNYVKVESQRRTLQELITMNRQCSQLKKVWINRGLPVDRESLQSAAAGKDAFDLSSLSESLPSAPQEREEEMVSKAKKLTKEFLSIVALKRLLLKRTEMASITASPTSESSDNLASCSHKVHEPNTLSQMVKKVCGDKKNLYLFSLKPFIRAQKCPGGSLNSSISREIISVPEFQELANSCKDQKNEKQSLYGESKLQDNLTQSKEIMPKCFHLIKRCEERHSYMTKRLQQLRDNFLLDRQMSRLKITNSRREDLSEAGGESEIRGSSSIQIDDEQDKATRENRRKAISQKLKELLKLFEEQRIAEGRIRSVKEMKLAKEI